jgi:hypothetical protein
MAIQLSKCITPLRLPNRYEALERAFVNNTSELNRVIQPIDSAIKRVESLLHQVSDGGLGRFEVFLGESGSGKTTFFKSLPSYFKYTTFNEVPSTLQLSEVPSYIRVHNKNTSAPQIWVLSGRENPRVQADEIFEFFDALRVLFREESGKVLILWPVSDRSQADLIADQAWETGRDSLVDLTKGLFRFAGPHKDHYFSIADSTARMITGQGLSNFGLCPESVGPLIQVSETISEFYERLKAKSSSINGLSHEALFNYA